MDASPERWALAGVALNLVAWAQRAGIDRAALLEEAELPPALVQNAVTRIPVTAISRLWHAVARRSSDPAFALSVGASTSIAMLQGVGLRMQAARNLVSATRELMENSHLLSNMFDGATKVRAGHLMVSYRWRDPDQATALRYISEAIAAQWVTFPALLTAERPQPVRCKLPGPAPSHTRHQEFFRCPIEYGTPALEVWWTLEDASKDFLFHEPRLASSLNLGLDVLRSPTPSSAAKAVQIFLAGSSAPGAVRAAEVARGLGLSTRTLQRRLAAEQTSLRDVRETWVMERAKEMLSLSDMTTERVAGLLGYASRSAFERAFVRVLGRSPASVRKMPK